MKKRILFIALIAFSFASKILAQSNTEITVQDKPEHVGVFYTGDAVTLPADFPVFVNTGDAEKDNIAYANALNNWLENNRELYYSLLAKTRQAAIEGPAQTIGIGNLKSNQGPSAIENNQLYKDAITACIYEDGFYTISKEKLVNLSSEIQFYISLNNGIFIIK